MSTPTNAYIREAKLPAEFGELSAVAARAFASHPLNTYWSNQKVAVHLQEGKQKEKSLRELARLLESTLRFVWLTGGRIMVVVVPDADGKEHLAAGAAWSAPDSSEKASLLAVLRAKFHRSILDWGLPLLKVRALTLNKLHFVVLIVLYREDLGSTCQSVTSNGKPRHAIMV